MRKDSPHQMPFIFKAQEEGNYVLCAMMSYKEKAFINSGQNVSEKTEKAFHKFQITKMFSISERVIYQEKEATIVHSHTTQSYPLLVQYKVENMTEKRRQFQAELLADKFFCECLLVPRDPLSPKRPTSCCRSNPR